MESLGKRLRELRESKNLSQADLAKEFGKSQVAISKYENDSRQLDYEMLNKYSKFFNVSTDFLLGNGAFVCWNEINANRKAFLEYAGVPTDKLQLLWGINSKNVNTISLHDFIQFIDATIKDVTLTADGDFEVELKEGFQEQKEKPDLPQKDEPEITFDDFTYAFLDESKELTEENKQKLLEMAKFFKQQQDKEKNE